MLAAIAVMLFCFVAALSMGVLTVWASLLGVLLFALTAAVVMALVGCIGIILCGFAFVLVGKGAGGALLFGSLACIGLFSALSHFVLAGAALLLEGQRAAVPLGTERLEPDAPQV